MGLYQGNHGDYSKLRWLKDTTDERAVKRKKTPRVASGFLGKLAEKGAGLKALWNGALAVVDRMAGKIIGPRTVVTAEKQSAPEENAFEDAPVDMRGNKTDKLRKIFDVSKALTRRNATFAGLGLGSLLVGAGIAALTNSRNPDVTYHPAPKIDYAARRDSLIKADQKTTDSLFATAAADVVQTQAVLDSFYTAKLNAFDKEWHDKDSAVSVSAMQAADLTQALFKQDSAKMVGGHPGLIFKVDNGSFTVESKVRYNTRTLYARELTRMTP